MWVRTKEDKEHKSPMAFEIYGAYVYDKRLYGYTNVGCDRTVLLGVYEAELQTIGAFNKIMGAVSNNGNFVDLNFKF